MKTSPKVLEVDEKRGKRFVAFLCKNIFILMSTSLNPIRSQVDSVEEGENAVIKFDRDEQFKAYVNNRLSVLFLWLQRPRPRDVSRTKPHLEFFLHDMEHHFIDSYAAKEIRNAFRWIRRYVKAYPRVLKKDRTQRAYAMLAKVYEGLDLEFPFRGRIKNHD